MNSIRLLCTLGSLTPVFLLWSIKTYFDGGYTSPWFWLLLLITILTLISWVYLYLFLKALEGGDKNYRVTYTKCKKVKSPWIAYFLISCMVGLLPFTNHGSYSWVVSVVSMLVLVSLHLSRTFYLFTPLLHALGFNVWDVVRKDDGDEKMYMVTCITSLPLDKVDQTEDVLVTNSVYIAC